MQQGLTVLAILLGATSAGASPPVVASDADSSSGAAVTRSVALWTHGIAGAASLVGGAVYGIRGLQSSRASDYEDECDAGVAGGCDRFEATQRELRVDQSLGGALLLYSLTSVSSFLFLRSTDATRLDASRQVPASVFYGTSAALSLVTAGLFAHTLKLRSDFSDAADACFEGDCNEARHSEADVTRSLVWPLGVSVVSYALSLSTAVWLGSSAPSGVSWAPTLDPHFAGATVTGRF